ncbi:MAG: hypothetical protein NZ455_02105 [Bacteroidia bacterium]|nr:hypothetical protein [Bacteroidia bacterium]
MRNEVQHRSVCVVRNAPTRAPARDTPKKVKLFFRLDIRSTLNGKCIY